MIGDEELGGAPSEGVDVVSSSFPSIMNRGLSNQQDFEINNEVNVNDLWRLTVDERGPAHTQPIIFCQTHITGKQITVEQLTRL